VQPNTDSHSTVLPAALLAYESIPRAVRRALPICLCTWAAFSNASWVFSVAVIIANVVLVVLLISGIAGLLIGHAQFAIRKKPAEVSSTRAKQAGAATN
jgi:hypothetical protein